MEYTIKVYKTTSGKQPFYQWLEKLSDNESHAAIDMRLDRLKAGNLGQSKSLNGVFMS